MGEASFIVADLLSALFDGSHSGTRFRASPE
jgi:hypothetical protein